MLYTMNDVALSSFTIDDTLLEEVATAVGPGPYFDGSFADTPTANYGWEGSLTTPPARSTSRATLTTTPWSRWKP